MLEREDIVEALRDSVRRGKGLPNWPEAADLYDACGGDGRLALYYMLAFISAWRQVAAEYGIRTSGRQPVPAFAA